MNVSERSGRGRERAFVIVRRAALAPLLLIAPALLVLPMVASAADPPIEPPELGDASKESTDPDFLIDKATGHPFRVRFNPARRFSIGLGAASQPLSDDGIIPTLEASIGLSFRSIFSFGAGPGLIIWQIDHQFASGWIWPLRRPVSGFPAMDAVLYSVSLHRHDELPGAVLPVSPPVSIPFPFDLGFEADVGRVFVPGTLPEGATAAGGVPIVRIGVLRASFFLDPWRSVKPGRSLEIGVGARYDVEPTAQSPTGGLSDARMLHRVAPKTATSLRFRFQSDNGLTVLDLRGDFIPHWTSEQTWKIMALGEAKVERTILAINDEPINLILEGNYRRTPESKVTKSLNDLRVSLALSFNVQIP